MRQRHAAKLRKDGLYECRITVDGRQVSKYGKTAKEAERKIALLESEVQRGLVVENKISLIAALRQYLKTVKLPNVKPSTYDRVECVVNNQIAHAKIAKKPIGKIKSDELQIWLLSLTKELSYSTVKKSYDLLGEFFRYMVDTRQLNYNPMKVVHMPHRSLFTKQTKPMECMTQEEMRRVITAATEIKPNGEPRFRYGEAVVLLLFTGLRSGELRALRIADVDLRNRVLHVESSICHFKDRVNGGVTNQVSTTKTKKSKRIVPLSDRALEAVRRLLETTANPETGFLITTTKGSLLSHSYFQCTYDDILKSAGLSHMGLHSTRHSFATSVLKDAEEKGQIKEVSELLGHSTVSTTYEFYIQTSNEDKRNLVNHLDGLIF